MSEKTVLPWFAVNELMDDEYRKLVIAIALGYLAQAPKDLQTFANKHLNKYVSVPGFRFIHLAKEKARIYVANQMPKNPFVTEAVICLWGEAMAQIIANLREHAQAQGITFQAEWIWREARLGYYADDQTPEFVEICEKFIKDKSKPDSDHFKLAQLWLSRALIESEPTTATPTLEPQPQTEVATNISAETKGKVVATLASKLVPPSVVSAPNSSSRSRPNVPLDEPTLADATFDTIYPQLRQGIGNIEKAHQTAMTQMRPVLQALEAYDPTEAQKGLAIVSATIQTWVEQQAQLNQIGKRALELLQSQVILRPDLSLDFIQNEPEKKLDGVPKPLIIATQIRMMFECVQDYDRQKQNTRTSLEQSYQRVLALQKRLVSWGITSENDLAIFAGILANPSATLTDLRNASLGLQPNETRLNEAQTRLRAEFETRIQTANLQLLNLGIPAANLSTATPSLEQLADFAKTLEQKLADETAKANAVAVPTLVGELRQTWTGETLALLLQQLARSKRNVEALLLWLIANTTQPSSDFQFDHSVVDSLLNGIEELSGENSFELLSQIAFSFQNGWKPADSDGLVRLCLAYLGAQYATPQSLPTGFLWEITQEWPVRGMPTWEKLWQAAVIEDALPLLYSGASLQVESLQKAHVRAEQMLERKGGLFVHLHSLKHSRHKALLTAEFLPELAKRQTELHQIQEELEIATVKISKVHQKLVALSAGGAQDLLDENKLNERYQSRVLAEGIDDAAPFHLRSAINVLCDCAKAVSDYQQALSEHIQVRMGLAKGLSLETLQSELGKVPAYQTQGRQTLARLQVKVEDKVARDENQAWIDGTRRMTAQLLSHPMYAMQMPRLVAKLTQAPLNLVEIIEVFLDDLTDSPSPDHAVELLLESGAPNQALMHVNQISLDLQNRAQTLKTEREHQTATLHTELLKLGGEVDDLAQDRTLGRWGYLTRELEQRLTTQRAKCEQEGQRQQDRKRAMLGEINKFDDEILDASAIIPSDVHGMFGQGLDLARKLIRTTTELDSIDTFLKELRYRFEHRSWVYTDLEEAIGYLEGAVRGNLKPTNAEFTSTQVLALLEREETFPLGLGAQVTSSSIGTRADLLRNWIRLEKINGFLSTEMNLGDRNAIKVLFRSFAQMVRMRRALGINGVTLDFDDPVVFSHYELQYPKTDVLKSNCILLAMPGKPVRPDDLKELEHLIDEKKWLDYSFILLFMPGCTEGNRKRLEAQYRRKLVLIDERTLLNMILSEARGKNPLGRLRSLMLHSCGVENVEVFRFNQLVNPHTAIFVGREGITDKVVNSDGSFALYGGRRIGKSSILMEIQDQLEQRGTTIIAHSFEGEKDCSDDASARKLARLLRTEIPVGGIGDFKIMMQSHLDQFPRTNLVVLLDEIDRYIEENRQRHILIEALRSLADQYAGRFRVVVAGFMRLYECLSGRGPYTPTSDPWQRMFNKDKPVENVKATSAEKIVREGFLDILDWEFENRGIPQLIVERTGCHPAFVQRFCDILQSRVALRGDDHVIRVEDVEAVFNDRNPTHSFIAYVRNTLEMNLDPISRYLILFIAAESKANSFTLDLAKYVAQMCKTSIPESRLMQSLDRLKVTSVVEERSVGMYEFSVPDYPLILKRLGHTEHMDRLEIEISEYLRKNGHTN